MRKLLGMSLLLFLALPTALPQAMTQGGPRAFYELDQQVAKEPGGIAGDKQKLSALFNAVDEYERCLYRSIGITNSDPCKRTITKRR